MVYPKRLIEVDLPIKLISEHARREKSIRHGHISTLHIWWARRPLAACRAVLCAALWLDPADPLCPRSFREAVAEHLPIFAKKVATNQRLAQTASEHTMRLWRTWSDYNVQFDVDDERDLHELRHALLIFIADFANWDNSTLPEYLEITHLLTQAAHEAIGGIPGTRPMVVDPFAGGGAIPLEALRVGADAYASDLNPLPILLNKVVLEYIPRYGQLLADEVRKWGAWIKEQAEIELAEFYPKDKDGSTPVAYLWARTVISDAPLEPGEKYPVEIPLMRSMWLSKKSSRSVALRWIHDETGSVKTETISVKYADGTTRTVRRPLMEMFTPKKVSDVPEGTVKRGNATCPVTGVATTVESIRRQMRMRRGGSTDARLFAIVAINHDQQRRFYRLPTQKDFEAIENARVQLENSMALDTNVLSRIPDEPLPPQGSLGFRIQLYGMEKWGDLFTSRQLLSLTSLARLTQEVGKKLEEEHPHDFAVAVQTLLGLAVSKLTDIANALCSWQPQLDRIAHLFARQAIPIVWDFPETNLITKDAAGDFNVTVGNMLLVVEREAEKYHVGQVQQSSATHHPQPDDAIQVLFTDPPYYDAVPYSDLSDFFFVWIKRTVGNRYPELFSRELAPKDEECIVDPSKSKDGAFFRDCMGKAMYEGRRILAPNGIGIVVFAHKSTAGWEAQLQAMVDAGWTITGSWAIDTEMGSRLRAINSAALASSIHLVCRPREDEYGNLTQHIGDWREVLAELPKRIHAWLPRLEQEGIVGADALFACIGPAMEIFSRYARVEKASGEVVTLREYLEHVWGAISREALGSIFEGADTSGFEEDARLTAMWLWTLRTNMGGGTAIAEDEEVEPDEDAPKAEAVSGFELEYDAARKISQGLGAHLEALSSLVEIRGGKARLLPVENRAVYLFGRDAGKVAEQPRRNKTRQLSLFEVLDEADAAAAGWTIEEGTPPAKTMLDRLHQSMIFHAAGRTEALRRFLVDDGVGGDVRFWRLADALSRLYPMDSDEKRWVDGVLARKKGLGF